MNHPNETQRIKVAAADIDGILRGKYMRADKFKSAAKDGFGFCSVVFGWDCGDACYDHGTLTGWHNGYPDINARIDLNTERRIPWDHQVPFFLADFENADGSPFAACPRQLLKSTIRRCEALGYFPKFGFEFEWFNFNETPHSLREKGFDRLDPITPGMFGYSILRQSMNAPFFAALFDELERFKIPLEGLHTETGPGVLEAAITYCDALEAADRAVLFKSAVKEIAQRFGYTATFMARINNQLPGSGGHMHQSLVDAEGSNLFFAPEKPDHMSDLFRHYLAGQLALMPELLLMYAPNVNSYKRLTEGFWAPIRQSWGVDNRTVAARVLSQGKATRLETRVGGADINPYLALSAALASGLWGIENRLELTLPKVSGNGYDNATGIRFARDLPEAIAAFENSALAKQLFGNDFVTHYANSRRFEHKQFQKTVTTYERERYLEII